MKATRRKKFNIDALEPIIDKDIWPIVKAINDKGIVTEMSWDCTVECPSI